jgi:hypothetical protein
LRKGENGNPFEFFKTMYKRLDMHLLVHLEPPEERYHHKDDANNQLDEVDQWVCVHVLQF